MARRTPRLFQIIALAIVAVIVGVGFFARHLLADPNVVFLQGDGRASWIRPAQPLNPLALAIGRRSVEFRTSFQIKENSSSFSLTVRALRQVTVMLDGAELFQSPSDLSRWKEANHVSIPAGLRPGRHVLTFRALNEGGPCLIQARSDELNLYTDRSWESRNHEFENWSSVEVAQAPEVPGGLGQFPTAANGFVTTLAMIVPISIGFLISYSVARKRSRYFQNPAQVVRVILLLLWVALAINNLFKLPAYFGYDSEFHLQYIRAIAAGYLPVASDGWQMFQSPLYYLLSAPFYKAFVHLFSFEANQRALRFIPLLCGLSQVEICYRMLARLLPSRSDLQAVGTLIGGLLPFNVYMSQTLSNEPLAGALGALSLLIGIYWVTAPSAASTSRWMMLWGGMTGLCILTKVSGMLWIPPSFVLIVYVLRTRSQSWLSIAGSLAIWLGSITAICGWFFIRNWIKLGKPFISGSDSIRGHPWWQDPGYRTIHDLYRFGSSLVQPVFSGTHGLWDSIYSTLWADGFLLGQVPGTAGIPPWNYSFMSATVLWALLPTILILVGFITSARRDCSQLYLVSCVLLGLLAIALQFIELPIYGCAKASYLLAATPCFAVLAAMGFDLLQRKRFLKRLCVLGIVSWAISVYLSFLIL